MMILSFEWKRYLSSVESFIDDGINVHIFTFESFFSIFTVTLHFSPLPSQTHHERRDHREHNLSTSNKINAGTRN